MHSSIRIGLVTDHPIFRTGVTQALSAVANLAVVAHGRSAEDALQMASHAGLDILLLEIEIPGVGMNVLGSICRTKCSAKVVVLTALDEEIVLIDALRLGARGYILKAITGADLIGAIEGVNRGEYYITPCLASRVLPRLLTQTENLPAHRDLNGLTSRERQVLSYLSRGFTNREIALKLGLSVKTIKQHKTLLFAKIGVRNRVEATAVLHEAYPGSLHADGGLALVS
jgi:two-component system, NarL family, nitrate/nitrite response regulator NarL